MPTNQPAFAKVIGQEKLHGMMMDAELALNVLEKVMDERAGKDGMKNKVFELLKQELLGWSPSHISLGVSSSTFLWVNGCHKILEGRRPHVFSEICR
jgi:hypothetical protein